VIKVAVTMPATIGEAGEFLADVRALEAAGAEMVGLEGDSLDQTILLAAVAAVTDRLRLRFAEAEPPELLQKLGRGRVVSSLPAGETWVEVPIPADKSSWKAILQEHEAAGASGVIVRWDPRLIDLLRNPEPDDRGDLDMSVG
jgi:hypothetical protein